MSPRRRAVLNPLVQRCTSAPTNRVDVVPGPIRPVLVGMSKGNGRLTPIKIIVSDQHPGRGHTHVTSAGGGTPLMTTNPTLTRPDLTDTAHSSAPGGLVKSVVELDRSSSGWPVTPVTACS